jgi:hypothetical protein
VAFTAVDDTLSSTHLRAIFITKISFDFGKHEKLSRSVADNLADGELERERQTKTSKKARNFRFKFDATKLDNIRLRRSSIESDTHGFSVISIRMKAQEQF